MIFNVILAIVAFIVQGVASILPTINLFPATLASSISSLVSSANGWSWIFPIGTLLTVIGAMVLLVLAEFTFFAAIYILKLIRG